MLGASVSSPVVRRGGTKSGVKDRTSGSVVAVGKPIELGRGAPGDLDRGKPRACARPFKRLLEGAVQGVDLGEGLAADGRQAIERRVRHRTRERAASASVSRLAARNAGSRPMRASPSARACRLARSACERGDLLADRRPRSRRLFAHQQICDGREDEAEQRRRDKGAAHAACIVGLDAGQPSCGGF